MSATCLSIMHHQQRSVRTNARLKKSEGDVLFGTEARLRVSCRLIAVGSVIKTGSLRPGRDEVNRKGQRRNNIPAVAWQEVLFTP